MKHLLLWSLLLSPLSSVQGFVVRDCGARFRQAVVIVRLLSQFNSFCIFLQVPSHVSRMVPYGETRSLPPPTTRVDLFGGEMPDPDLIVGYGVIAAACLPYTLSLFFENFFFDKFFLPLYPDTEEGREAEVGWKVRYASLALALTTFVAGEVLWDPQRDIVETLRDSYVVWALFYTEAIRKIRSEAESGLLQENRLGIQLWHSFVVIVLWADLSQSPLGNQIVDFIKDLFT
jgi:hypothetical protein